MRSVHISINESSRIRLLLHAGSGIESRSEETCILHVRRERIGHSVSAGFLTLGPPPWSLTKDGRLQGITEAFETADGTGTVTLSPCSLPGILRRAEAFYIHLAHWWTFGVTRLMTAILLARSLRPTNPNASLFVVQETRHHDGTVSFESDPIEALEQRFAGYLAIAAFETAFLTRMDNCRLGFELLSTGSKGFMMSAVNIPTCASIQMLLAIRHSKAAEIRRSANWNELTPILSPGLHDEALAYPLAYDAALSSEGGTQMKARKINAHNNMKQMRENGIVEGPENNDHAVISAVGDRLLEAVSPDLYDPFFTRRRDRWIEKGHEASRLEIDAYMDDVLAIQRDFERGKSSRHGAAA